MSSATTAEGVAEFHNQASGRRCRSCGAPQDRLFVDLGMSPPCEGFLTQDRLLEPETLYPFDVRICDRCVLVQLPAYITANSIFTEYAYFSFPPTRPSARTGRQARRGDPEARGHGMTGFDAAVASEPISLFGRRTARTSNGRWEAR